MALGIDTLLKAARRAERASDPATAQRAYVEVLERYPGNMRARAALATLDQALIPRYQALSPDYAALAHLATLYENQAFGEALEHVDALLAAFPHCHFLLFMNGVISAGAGQIERAVAALEAALAIKPDYAEAHFHLGKALAAAGQAEAALGFHVRAVALRQDHAPWWTELGLLYARRLVSKDAIMAFERALALDPNDIVALVTLADVQRSKGQTAKAITNYARALALAPEGEEVRVALLMARAEVADWSEAEKAEEASAQEAWPQEAWALGLGARGVSPFAMIGLDPDPARALVRARTFAASLAEHAGDVAPASLPAPATDGRIRVGYFSADFHDHATMYLMSGLFREHDRSRFAVHAYSYGPSRSEPWRAFLDAHCDGFHDVLDMPDAAIAGLAREHGLDIAIDLKGYTKASRTALFAHRPAPTQVQWLGFPGTSGADFMDYILADHIVIPGEARAFYSEAVIRIPGSYQPNDNRRAIAPVAPDRSACGLPETGLVLCCFNQIWKIGRDEFTIWMDLLRQVPGSVLWLHGNDPLARTNLERAAKAQGVGADRLVFAATVPHAEHLARLQHADLVLDCFIYGAHTTASDALWVGVPVLTCAGRAFPARVAASLLTAVGLPELITSSREDYANLAVALATDRERLAALRTRLAARRSTCALFDTSAHTRAVEAAWTVVVERARAGLAPADIDF